MPDQRAGLTEDERARAARVGAGLATALGALCELATNGCPTDKVLAQRAIDDVNEVTLNDRT
jgi:hypothetical protein